MRLIIQKSSLFKNPSSHRPQHKMLAIHSLQEFHNLLTDRPPTTKTYRGVGTEVIEGIWDRQSHWCSARQMSNRELSLLAEYLDVPQHELRGPFLVDSRIACSHCLSAISFVDFVSTAVEGHQHNKKMIADILCGRGGFWVTIGGKNAERVVKCFHCKTANTYQSHTYSSPNYAYA